MTHKDVNIELEITEVQRHAPGCVTIFFKRPVSFVFEAGDWMDIDFKDSGLKGGKTYSLSSSPTEPDLVLSFREGVSPFKSRLQDCAPGDKLHMSQYGNDYNFQLSKHHASVLIAGGIGIAPFRSMLKEMVDTGSGNDVSLIYLNQDDQFLFRDELDTWAKALPNIKISYIQTKDINQKKRQKLIQSAVTELSQNFYISGPPGMVETTEHLLIDMGVNVRDIRIDSFSGY